MRQRLLQFLVPRSPHLSNYRLRHRRRYLKDRTIRTELPGRRAPMDIWSIYGRNGSLIRRLRTARYAEQRSVSGTGSTTVGSVDGWFVRLVLLIELQYLGSLSSVLRSRITPLQRT
jgi:hypothetical protein